MRCIPAGHEQDPAGDMDEMHAWRNEHGADLVVLLMGVVYSSRGTDFFMLRAHSTPSPWCEPIASYEEYYG